jgi:hypothetical protein
MVVTPHQIALIGLGIVGGAILDGLFFGGQQLDLQRRDDGLRDLVLEREDVVQIAIIPLRPDMTIA